ncbi:MAG: anthranilate synthase component I, partial [Alphaproteobacteria bacterium]|nr:anthranilate synthase component I [Alphaproteobacteria bacterium]
MKPTIYSTKGGIRITREIRNHDYQPADTALAQSLDARRGVLFSSSFEFPGRYTRWDMGFVDPPLVFTARGRDFAVEALNERGQVLLSPVAESLASLTAIKVEHRGRDR